METTLYAYILSCKDGCYYVGLTENLDATYMEHWSGVASPWTRLHTPLKVEFVVRNAESYDETALLRECFRKYGIDRVRGGPFDTIELSAATRKSIEDSLGEWGGEGNQMEVVEEEEDELDGLTNAFKSGCTMYNKICKRCGGDTHSAAQCVASHDINGEEIMSDGNYSDFEDL